MATFHAIRYVRGFRNSEMFEHIEAGGDRDSDLAIAGTYQGARYPKATFGDALIASPKRIAKLHRNLVEQGFPPEIMEIVVIEMDEPAPTQGDVQ